VLAGEPDPKSLADLKDKKLGVQSMEANGTTFATAFVKEGRTRSAEGYFVPAIGLGAQASPRFARNWSMA